MKVSKLERNNLVRFSHGTSFNFSTTARGVVTVHFMKLAMIIVCSTYEDINQALWDAEPFLQRNAPVTVARSDAGIVGSNPI
jgi:hypothetical protein